MSPLSLFLRHFARSFWIALFPFSSAVIATIALLWLPQGRELLNAISDQFLSLRLERLPDLLHYCLFVGALYAWGMTNWYTARLLLRRHYWDLLAGNPNTGPVLTWWFTWFPRLLAIVGIGAVCTYLALRGEVRAGVLAAIGLIPLVLFQVRRQGRFKPQDAGAARLKRGDWIALGLSLSFALVLLVAITIANYTLARFLGTPVILFLGFSGLVIFGAIVLTYLPISYDWPNLVWVPPALAVVFAALSLNRNHAIEPRFLADQEPVERPEVVEHFKAWVRSRPEDGRIILVAAEGGASRAGWWAGHVLGALDYASDGMFSNQVYAISSVSGGSLGAATYVALLDERHPMGSGSTHHALQFPTRDQCNDLRTNRELYPLPMQIECMLRRDYLGPTIGYLLFPDLLQRFVPYPVSAWDRSLGLEKSFERDWAYLFGSEPQAGVQGSVPRLTTPFGSSMSRLHRDKGDMRLPLLLLNSARAKAGRTVLQATVRVVSPELDDFFDARLNTRGLRLSGAVHNSARFPLISPGGDVTLGNGDHWDAVIDAGYIEGSGAATLAELVRLITRAAQDGRNGDDDMLRASLQRLDVLYLMNGPDDDASVIDQRPPDDTYDMQPVIRQEELMTPLVGLYSARTARSSASKRYLIELLPAGRTGATEAFLSRGAMTGEKPSMSWYLNDQSRRTMWAAVGSDKNGASLCRLLKRVLGDEAPCDRIYEFKATAGEQP